MQNINLNYDMEPSLAVWKLPSV